MTQHATTTSRNTQTRRRRHRQQAHNRVVGLLSSSGNDPELDQFGTSFQSRPLWPTLQQYTRWNQMNSQSTRNEKGALATSRMAVVEHCATQTKSWSISSETQIKNNFGGCAILESNTHVSFVCVSILLEFTFSTRRYDGLCYTTVACPRYDCCRNLPITPVPVHACMHVRWTPLRKHPFAPCNQELFSSPKMHLVVFFFVETKICWLLRSNQRRTMCILLCFGTTIYIHSKRI